MTNAESQQSERSCLSNTLNPTDVRWRLNVERIEAAAGAVGQRFWQALASFWALHPVEVAARPQTVTLHIEELATQLAAVAGNADIDEVCGWCRLAELQDTLTEEVGEFASDSMVVSGPKYWSAWAANQIPSSREAPCDVFGFLWAEAVRALRPRIAASIRTAFADVQHPQTACALGRWTTQGALRGFTGKPWLELIGHSEVWRQARQLAESGFAEWHYFIPVTVLTALEESDVFQASPFVAALLRNDASTPRLNTAQRDALARYLAILELVE